MGGTCSAHAGYDYSYKILVGPREENLRNVGVVGKITLIWFLKKRSMSVWAGFRVQWRAVVNTVTRRRVLFHKKQRKS